VLNEANDRVGPNAKCSPGVFNCPIIASFQDCWVLSALNQKFEIKVSEIKG